MKIAQEDKQKATPTIIELLRETESTTLQCCISYNEHGGYCVPLSSRHRPATQKILSKEVWEPQTINYITNHCGSGDIIHAGTYFGDFIPALSHACAPDAKVWAFEPNRENYRCAVITTLINGLGNVQIANAGLGSQKGSAPMRIADNRGKSLGGASRFTNENYHNCKEQFITVDIVTIDEVVPANRRVSILQLDVEGHEQEALAGAIKTIRRCQPILILESLPHHQEWLSRYLFKMGYRATGEVHANTIFEIK